MSKKICLFVFMCLILTAFCDCLLLANDAADTGNVWNEKFPIIMFAVPNNDSSFQTVKEIGCNYVHAYGMGFKADSEIAYFDRAEKYELKVMADLSGKRAMKTDNPVKTLTDYLDGIGNPNSLGFWYLADEPDRLYTATQLLPLYNLLKEKSPGLPVAIAHAWTEKWHSYGSVQDIMMYDYYPICGGPVGGVSEHGLSQWTSFTKSVFDNAKSNKDKCIPIIQSFDWRVFVEKGVDTYRGQPVASMRLPNLEELRYMNFLSLALGADGLAYWSYSRLMQSPDNAGIPWANTVLKTSLNEVKEFVRQSGYKKDAKVVKRIQTEDYVLCVLETKKESDWVILVNTTDRAQDFNIELPLLKSFVPNNFFAEGDKRQSLVVNTKYNINAKPWEVFVWKILGVSSNLEEN